MVFQGTKLAVSSGDLGRGTMSIQWAGTNSKTYTSK